MIDIGVNLLSSQFDRDRSEQLTAAAAAGLQALLITGTTLTQSRAAIAYCNQQGKQRDDPKTIPCFATAGVHPHYTADIDDDWQSQLSQLAESPWVKAMGEMGLDYFRDLAPRSVQRQCFSAQIELAATLQLPAFVHDRKASTDCGAIIREHITVSNPVVVHCFTGTGEALEQYLSLGCYIGITGWVCDVKRGEALRELVPSIPLDRLLIESDAPYLRPDNAPVADHLSAKAKRQQRRNTPALLPYVVTQLAQLYDEEPATIATVTARNANQLFALNLALSDKQTVTAPHV